MLHKLEFKKSTFYIGLFLWAALDTLDYEILLSIRKISFAFQGSFLCFQKNYLRVRSPKKLIKNVLPSEKEIKTGVSQGSL